MLPEEGGVEEDYRKIAICGRFHSTWIQSSLASQVRRVSVKRGGYLLRVLTYKQELAEAHAMHSARCMHSKT